MKPPKVELIHERTTYMLKNMNRLQRNILCQSALSRGGSYVLPYAILKPSILSYRVGGYQFHPDPLAPHKLNSTHTRVHSSNITHLSTCARLQWFKQSWSPSYDSNSHLYIYLNECRVIVIEGVISIFMFCPPMFCPLLSSPCSQIFYLVRQKRISSFSYHGSFQNKKISYINYLVLSGIQMLSSKALAISEMPSLLVFTKVT